ncbi:MAG: ParB N-terminal domain-containing protein [Spirochaetota bacterium]|jgi:ParB/RepB/Spo0J family partition protein|nr:ParB N-terminal domain-containing protein [Spirochaetota bacterium]
MAKMGGGSGLKKLAIDQIECRDNVRIQYADIEALAESIKAHGQLAPVLVKALGPDDDGIEQYELISGHRRYRAIRLLCDKGESFTTIDAMLIAGDKLTLQLVENLQRSDLTSAEREAGIYKMCQNNIQQKEIAARLSKDEVFVSKNVCAYTVRAALEREGICTARLSTRALFEMHKADPQNYPFIARQTLERGGSSRDAIAVMRDFFPSQKPRGDARADIAVSAGNDATPARKQAERPANAAQEARKKAESLAEGTAAFRRGFEEAQKNLRNVPREKSEAFDPPEKMVSFRAVYALIMRYREECLTAESINANYRHCRRSTGAADILELLQYRIDTL